MLSIENNRLRSAPCNEHLTNAIRIVRKWGLRVGVGALFVIVGSSCDVSSSDLSRNTSTPSNLSQNDLLDAIDALPQAEVFRGSLGISDENFALIVDGKLEEYGKTIFTGVACFQRMPLDLVSEGSRVVSYVDHAGKRHEMTDIVIGGITVRPTQILDCTTDQLNFILERDKKSDTIINISK